MFLIFVGLLLTAASSASAKALFDEKVSTEKRLEMLKPFFDPPLDAALELDRRDLLDKKKRRDPEKLRGFIKVAPPKGACFTITTDREQPDEVVCKKTNLAYELGQLDYAGRLRWRVSTGDGDFGTDIRWASSYRVASAILEGEAPNSPQKMIRILSCTALRHDRRILLETGLGDTWVVRLPREDKLTPQPDAIPNLFLGHGLQRSGIGATPEEKEKKDDDQGGGQDKDKSKDAPGPRAPRHDEFNQKREREEGWYIFARNAYEMSASNFMPNGSSPPGGKGKCRYSLQGPPDDPATGQLECHEAQGFYSILIPLTCLKDLLPR